MAFLGDLVAELTLDSTSFRRGIDKSTKQIKDFQSQTKRALDFIPWKTAVAGATALTGASVLLAKSVVETGIAFERSQKALQSATGSIEESQKATSFLRQESERLGLVFTEQVKGYTQISAAAKSWNLSAKETQNIYLGVAEAATAFQLSQDDVNGTFRAFSQIISKGKLQAEEIRGQLGERLPGAFQIAATSMGKTTAEFSKMLELGQVVSQDFIPKFSQALRDNFGEAAISAADSAQASVNRMKNSYTELKLLLSDSGVLYVFTAGIKAITDQTIKWFKANDDLIKQRTPEILAEGIVKIIQATRALVEVIRFVHNGWLGIKLVLQSIIVVIAGGFKLFGDLAGAIGLLFQPIYDQFANLNKLLRESPRLLQAIAKFSGLPADAILEMTNQLSVNPLAEVKNFADDFFNAQVEGFNNTVDEIVKTNAEYDALGLKIDSLIPKAKAFGQSIKDSIQPLQGPQTLGESMQGLLGPIDGIGGIAQDTGFNPEELKSIGKSDDFLEEMKMKNLAALGLDAELAREQFGMVLEELMLQEEALRDVFEQRGQDFAEMEAKFDEARIQSAEVLENKLTQIAKKGLELRFKYEKQITDATAKLKQQVFDKAINLIGQLLGQEKLAAAIGIGITTARTVAQSKATTILASELAFASQLIPGDPTSIVRAGAAKAAVLAAGASQIPLILASGALDLAGTLLTPSIGGGSDASGSVSSVSSGASQSVGTAEDILVAEQEAGAGRGISVSIIVQGNIIDQDEFARSIADPLRRALAEGA